LICEVKNFTLKFCIIGFNFKRPFNVRGFFNEIKLKLISLNVEMSQVGVVKKYETVTQTDGIEKLKDKILLDITYSARQTYKRRR